MMAKKYETCKQKLKDKMVEVAMLLTDLSEGQDCIYTSADVETEIPEKGKRLVMHFDFDIAESDNVAEKTEEE
mgnify:FL=1